MYSLFLHDWKKLFFLLSLSQPPYLPACRLGNAYGLLFHIEVAEETISDRMAEYEEETKAPDYLDSKKIKADTRKYIDGLYTLADRFYENFISILL